MKIIESKQMVRVMAPLVQRSKLVKSRAATMGGGRSISARLLLGSITVKVARRNNCILAWHKASLILPTLTHLYKNRKREEEVLSSIEL